MEPYVKGSDEKIHSENFLEGARKKKSDFTRKRALPFPVLCGFLLNTVHESLGVAIRRFAKKHNTRAVTEQSVSEARNKLNWEAFRELFEDTVTVAYSGGYDRFHGYRVWAIDGTTIALPNYPSLARVFGSENGSPTAHASILYDVLNYTTADALIDPLCVDERSMAVAHLAALRKKIGGEKELVILDRGYPSEALIDCCLTCHFSFVMRVKRKFNAAIDAQKKEDAYVQIGRHKIRVLKIVLDSGEIETLITNLKENFDFKTLYYLRWGVEKAYDVIKNTLEIENFSGRTETAIRQDFFIHMYTANILAAGYWEAKEQIDRERNTGEHKYEYKPNMAQASAAVRDYLILAILTDSFFKRRKYLKEMSDVIQSAAVPIRPDRIVPRRNSARNAKFHHNRKPNL